MKSIKIILFVITCWILWGLKENLAILPSSIQSNSLLIWLLNFTSFFTFIVLLCISYLIYKLTETFSQTLFFDSKSISLIKKIAAFVLFLAVLDISNRTLNDFFLKPQLAPFEILKDFFWRIVFISPTFLFCSILIFIFAEFMKKAIEIKNDHETII